MNEKYEVIGIGEHVERVSKAGRPYSGRNLYCSYESPRVTGFACTSVWIPSSVILPNLSVGDVVLFSYNRFGTITAVIPA